MDAVKEHEAMKLIAQLASLRASRRQFSELLEQTTRDMKENPKEPTPWSTINILTHTVASLSDDIRRINKVLLEEFYE